MILPIRNNLNTAPLKETILENNENNSTKPNDQIEAETTQFEINQAQGKFESDNENQNNTLVDYQLTKDRGRRSRFPFTRINNN